eukprot:209020-Pleurochrysis_carterae.AAC.1
MAARVLQVKLPSSFDPPWWEIFQADKQQMDEVCAAVTALYSRPKAQYVRLEPDPVKKKPAPAPTAAPAAAPTAAPAAAPAPTQPPSQSPSQP